MKYLINIIKKHRYNDITRPLGRWRLDTCNKIINNKIDLANEDNCGPCGQYAMAKNIENKNIINKNKDPK